VAFREREREREKRKEHPTLRAFASTAVRNTRKKGHHSSLFFVTHQKPSLKRERESRREHTHKKTKKTQRERENDEERTE